MLRKIKNVFAMLLSILMLLGTPCVNAAGFSGVIRIDGKSTADDIAQSNTDNGFDFNIDSSELSESDKELLESLLDDDEILKIIQEGGAYKIEYDSSSATEKVQTEKAQTETKKKTYDGQFTDIDSHWAYYYIRQCYENGLMIGTSDTTFSPESSMSVAEAITAAVRLAGKTVTNDGANWYDGAVKEAISLGIMQGDSFDSYTRPALRCEIAGLFGKAMPEQNYAEICNVEAICDVNAETPYYNEIYKLYRAGILTGSDNLGTFFPNNDITRAEVSAIMQRLSDSKSRNSYTMYAQPSDFTVYTTAYRVNIGGVQRYGVVKIGNDYFIPAELFDVKQEELALDIEFINSLDDDYILRMKKVSYYDKITTLDYSFAPVPGKAVGTAEMSPAFLSYNGGYYGAICTIDGYYPMINLKALGAIQQGEEFVISVEETADIQASAEKDLVGDVLPSLQRESTADTVRAIHDYIVNTLTYDPNVSAPWNITQQQLDAAASASETAKQTYDVNNNITLLSKYGVCADYTELFREMCIRSGIPCVSVTGDAMMNGYLTGHAWNRVYIDGKWSIVDATFDDPVNNTPLLRHDYYLIDADRLANDHLWYDDDYPLPEEYDPAWENIDPYNLTDRNMFRKCLIAQLAQGKTNFSLRGPYGGNVCAYAYSESWFASMRSSYNSSTGCYDYEVQYGF